MFFFELFLWKHREQFGQSGRTFSDNGPNFSWSTLKHVTKNTFFSNRYKVILGTRRMRFGNTAEQISTIGQKTLSQNPKTIKGNYIFSKKITFLQFVPLNTWNVAWRNPERIRRQKVEKMYLEVRMSWREHYKFKKHFSLKLVPWTRNRQLWQLYEFFLAGSWSFFGQFPKLLIELIRFAETNFLRNVAWKYKMQLWRTRKKLLDKKLTLFSSKS